MLMPSFLDTLSEADYGHRVVRPRPRGVSRARPDPHAVPGRLRAGVHRARGRRDRSGTRRMGRGQRAGDLGRTIAGLIVGAVERSEQAVVMKSFPVIAVKMHDRQTLVVAHLPEREAVSR